MKIAQIVIRTLLGLLFLFASITFLLRLFPEPELEGSMKLFNEGLAAAVYVMPLVKTIELLCGISFVTGRFVPLATVVIFPITVNIVLVHFFLAPEGIPVAIFVLLSNLFLAYYYRDRYKSLFTSK
ncbi:MAG: hypothetical protein RIG77_20060 [Cyclobacteriaceae bacterium]